MQIHYVKFGKYRKIKKQRMPGCFQHQGFYAFPSKYLLHLFFINSVAIIQYTNICSWILKNNTCTFYKIQKCKTSQGRK